MLLFGFAAAVRFGPPCYLGRRCRAAVGEPFVCVPEFGLLLWDLLPSVVLRLAYWVDAAGRLQGRLGDGAFCNRIPMLVRDLGPCMVLRLARRVDAVCRSQGGFVA